MPAGLPVRRGVNVSAYLQDLNTIPSPEEHLDDFNPEDLDLWTNTQFFDFDMGGQVPAYQPESPRERKPVAVEAPSASIVDSGLKEVAEFDNIFDGLLAQSPDPSVHPCLTILFRFRV